TGDLEAEPFAQLDRDARSSSSLGPETIRIKLNDESTGPYYDDTYSILVSVGNSTDLQTTKPSVRVIRAGANGGAEVDLFRLPAEAIEAATEWHVADLDGDGSLTAVGSTESITGSKASSDLVCIPELLAHVGGNRCRPLIALVRFIAAPSRR